MTMFINVGIVHECGSNPLPIFNTYPNLLLNSNSVQYFQLGPSHNRLSVTFISVLTDCKRYLFTEQQGFIIFQAFFLSYPGMQVDAVSFTSK